MRDPEDRREDPSSEPLGKGFWESFPLLATSAVLFVAGAVSWARGIVIGSVRFPLVALLVALGFMAAIGAVLSWFFAEGPTQLVEPRAPEKPISRPADTEERPGRPPPLVVAAPAPWDEGPVERPTPRPLTHSAKLARADLQQALQELDGLQQELTTRRVRTPEDQR